MILFDVLQYRKVGSISTGTYIREVRIFAAHTAWGTYNRGVLNVELKKAVV